MILGESEKNLTNLFKLAEAVGPSISEYFHGFYEANVSLIICIRIRCI
jgi:hypothetical protein